MVKWTEYREIARERGALALELYVVFSTPSNGPEKVKENLLAHLAYQRKMEEDGTLVLAGPLSDETGVEMQGAGLIIYRASSMAKAHRYAEDDPMHKMGARDFKLRKWLINEGSLTVDVKLSTRLAKLI